MTTPIQPFVMGAPRPPGVGKTVRTPGPSSSNYYNSPWYTPGSVGSFNPSGLATTGRDSLQGFNPLAAIRGQMRSYTPQNSVVNTLGINTNWYVPYARKAGQFAQATFDDFVTGQIIWTNKDKHRALERRTRQGEIAVDWPGGRPFRSGLSEDGFRESDLYYAKEQPLGARYSMFTLQRLNWTFALTELKPTDDEEKMMSAETRMSTWMLDGAVRNEEGGQDRTGEIFDETNEKVLNITIQGHAHVFNLWGNDIQPQTKLWFIVKRVPRHKLPMQYVVNGKGEGHHAGISKRQVRRIFNRNDDTDIDMDDTDESEQDDGSAMLTDYPFQVFPWASTKYDRPPPDVVRYRDDFGDIGYGKAIYFGKVDWTPRYVNGQRFGEVWHNTVAAVNSPKLWVFVDPKPNAS